MLYGEIDMLSRNCAICFQTLPKSTAEFNQPANIARLRIACDSCYEKALALPPVRQPDDDAQSPVLWVFARALAAQPTLECDRADWRTDGRREYVDAEATVIHGPPGYTTSVVPRIDDPRLFVRMKDGTVSGVFGPAGVLNQKNLTTKLTEALGGQVDVQLVAVTETNIAFAWQK